LKKKQGPPTPKQPPLDPANHLAQLDHLIQQVFKYQTHLATLMDETDDLKKFTRLFAVYSRSAVHLSRLLRDRQALAPACDDFMTIMGQALDEISAELGIEV
jgi:hypothetical protein